MDLKERGFGSRRHPWEIARTKALKKILRLFLDDPGHKKLLDIGCGDAFVLKDLQDHFSFKQAEGVDVNLTRNEIQQFSCERPDVQLQNSYNNLSQYDVVLMLDVLEHIQNDKNFLQETTDRYLLDNGILLVTVPAFQFLFSMHDCFLGHYRRYTRYELITLIQDNLKILAGGYLFSTLLPVRLVTCLCERLFQCDNKQIKGAGHWNKGYVISNLATYFLTLENFVLIALSKRNIYIPGLSVWILCRKQPS
jgi:SAM-dependent methyltransferase